MERNRGAPDSTLPDAPSLPLNDPGNPGADFMPLPSIPGAPFISAAFLTAPNGTFASFGALTIPAGAREQPASAATPDAAIAWAAATHAQPGILNHPDSTADLVPMSAIIRPDASTLSQAQVQYGGPEPGLSAAATGFTINLKYTAAALAAPQGFRDGIEQAAKILHEAIFDNITVNISVDYTGTNHGAFASPRTGQSVSYATVRSNLINGATPGDHTFDAMPAGTSIQGHSTVAVYPAQLKLASFGLLSPNDTSTDDGYTSFATNVDPNALVAAALHELTHALGRVAASPEPDIFDLFRFAAVGTRQFDFTTAATYFSLDNGNTKLADYGRFSDQGDFLSNGVQGANDSFNEIVTSGSLQQLTTVDLIQLDALGFHVRAPLFAQPTFQLAAFGPGVGGWSSNDTYPRELADVNKDGMADIVAFGQAGVYVSLATGGGAFASPTFNLAAFGTNPGSGGFTSNDTYPRELADVNGDGMADIVAFGQAGVLVSLATGGGSFGTPTFSLAAFGTNPGSGGWTSQNTYPRLLADINHDGMADIVAFGQAGVFVSLATGGGSFGTPTFNLAAFGTNPASGGWTSQDQYPRALADVNKDGNIDIVAFGQSGVYVARGNGDGSFQPVIADLQAFGTGVGGWSSENTYPRLVADVNHDGAADIVGFGQNGVYEALSNGFHLV